MRRNQFLWSSTAATAASVASVRALCRHLGHARHCCRVGENLLSRCCRRQALQQVAAEASVHPKQKEEEDSAGAFRVLRHRGRGQCICKLVENELGARPQGQADQPTNRPRSSQHGCGRPSSGRVQLLTFKCSVNLQKLSIVFTADFNQQLDGTFACPCGAYMHYC